MAKKRPVITIIGVPNTGKSTLFNRLIGKRKALIHSRPGMTRDILRQTFDLEGRSCSLQDSGGFFLDDQTISTEINKRVLDAAASSDVVIFLFDGRRELLGYEQDLFLAVSRTNQCVIPVMNKVDHEEKYFLPDSYYRLKLDYVMISAEHNFGISWLLSQVSSLLPPAVETEPTLKAPIRISIVGKPNVGKSSLVNSLLQEEHAIVSPVPGTTRDSIDIEITRNRTRLIIVDNAGIRKLKKVQEDTEAAAVIRAEKDIKNSDIIIFTLDISRKIDQNDLLIAQRIIKSAKPVIIAANKWDLVDPEKADSLQKRLKERFNTLSFAPIVFCSAKTGKSVFKLLDTAESIKTVITNARTIKTAQLNRIMSMILSEKKLRCENSRIFNPKYAFIESTKPFFIQFFSSAKSRLIPSDEIYLKRRLTRELKLEGVPIFFKVGAKKSRK